MMSFLLDTCVLSELVARKPNNNVLTWFESIDERQLFLSSITIGEIQKGVSKLPDSKRKQQLNAWLIDELLVRFEKRILALDAIVMLTWGEMAGDLEQRGKRMSAMDSLIAATAKHYELILVTRNESDFQNADITIYNPW